MIGGSMMKTIGLIGGMSWESTTTYYQIINTVIKEKLGGLHSAKCLLYSVDFAEIGECQAKDDWDKSGRILAEAGKSLAKAGADFIIICTNTMHKVIDQIQVEVHNPILHIAEVTADELIKQNIHKAALLGTKYTVEQDFYKSKLITKGIEVLINKQGLLQNDCFGYESQYYPILFCSSLLFRINLWLHPQYKETNFTKSLKNSSLSLKFKLINLFY